MVALQFHQKGEPLNFQEELSDQIETTSNDVEISRVRIARLEYTRLCGGLSLSNLQFT
jgi:hypothetical protein